MEIGILEIIWRWHLKKKINNNNNNISVKIEILEIGT